MPPYARTHRNLAQPRSHLGFGMIQLGSTGWMIADNAWIDGIRDPQQGSWLVRTASVVPEPPTVALLCAGVLALGLRRPLKLQEDSAL